MDSYCVKCKKRTAYIGKPKLIRTKNNRYILKGQCSICKTNKTRFVSKKEGNGLLSMLGIKTPLSKIPILGDIIF